MCPPENFRPTVEDFRRYARAFFNRKYLLESGVDEDNSRKEHDTIRAIREGVEDIREAVLGDRDYSDGLNSLEDERWLLLHGTLRFIGLGETEESREESRQSYQLACEEDRWDDAIAILEQRLQKREKPPQRKFHLNPNFIQYESILVDLHRLIKNGKGESDEADELRELMDEPGDNLSQEAINATHLISKYLYVVNGGFYEDDEYNRLADEKHWLEAGDIDGKMRQDFSVVFQQGRFETALEILSQRKIRSLGLGDFARCFDCMGYKATATYVLAMASEEYRRDQIAFSIRRFLEENKQLRGKEFETTFKMTWRDTTHNLAGCYTIEDKNRVSTNWDAGELKELGLKEGDSFLYIARVGKGKNRPIEFSIEPSSPGREAKIFLELNSLASGLKSGQSREIFAFFHSEKDGVAYIELDDEGLLSVDWDAEELRKSGIEERQSFLIKMIRSPGKFRYEFIPKGQVPLSEELADRIEELRKNYPERDEGTPEQNP